MSDAETVPVGRELILAFAYLRRCGEELPVDHPDELESVDVRSVEVMMGNALSAYLLLAYAHPGEELGVRELEKVGELVEEDWPVIEEVFAVDG